MQVRFIYNDVGADLKLHPKRLEPYVVNPYQIVANNGRFYLIGNYDKYDNVAYFRVDKITDVQLLEEKVKPMNKVSGLEKGLNLPKHMAEHIYMFSGESIPVKIKTTSDMIGQLVDWFGMEIKILEKMNDSIVVRFDCNFSAMRYWALQYGPYVEVLSPKELREQLKEDICKMADKYSLKGQL